MSIGFPAKFARGNAALSLIHTQAQNDNFNRDFHILLINLCRQEWLTLYAAYQPVEIIVNMILYNHELRLNSVRNSRLKSSFVNRKKRTQKSHV
jgi:hypothetical protein